MPALFYTEEVLMLVKPKKTPQLIAKVREQIGGYEPTDDDFDYERWQTYQSEFPVLAEGNSFTGKLDTPGALFRFFQKEYGQCTSHVYMTMNDKDIACGWTFQKRRQYDDSKETYLQEVWITLFHRIDPDGTPYEVDQLKGLSNGGPKFVIEGSPARIPTFRFVELKEV